jgi:hypothetical protein
VLVLCLADGAFRLTHYNPQKVVDIAPLVQNIQRSVDDKAVNPDVLIFGSSLSTCFTYDVDNPKAVELDETHRPTSSAPDPFLAGKLGKITGTEKAVHVMTLVGAMVTDLFPIIDSCYSSGKLPKTVVYLAGPRDFVDNTSPRKKVVLQFRSKSNTSTTAQATVKCCPTAAPARLSFYEQVQQYASKFLPAAITGRMETFFNKPSADLACQLTLDSTSEIFERRSQLRKAMQDLACNVLDRDADLWSAAHESRATERKMTHFEHDLGSYNMRYNPPDYKRMAEESAMLTKMANLVASHKSNFVIVDMPLTKENRKLLDPKLYSQYEGALTKLEAEGKAIVIRGNQWDFGREYFLDSAHLNMSGSKKLQLLLAPKIAATLKSH